VAADDVSYYFRMVRKIIMSLVLLAKPMFLAWGYTFIQAEDSKQEKRQWQEMLI
jgi:CHASE3 domain sensor protein